MTKRIAVIGGGISGLTAAHYLQSHLKGDYEISLFESSSRLGGVIETEKRDGVILEAGPDCFLSKKPWARDLCKEIGLSQELISTREGYRKSFIYSGGKMNSMPPGFYLMAPNKIFTLLKMPILSLLGKLRAALDLLIPARKEDSDESVAGFMKRRLGKEVFERIGQPMIGGIYGGDPEKLSLRATVPQFQEMEKKHGSVIRGLRKQQDQAHDTASGPRYSLFLSMKHGMEQIIHALVKELSRIKIYTACPIHSISRNGNFRLSALDGREFEADALILAAPAYAAARMLQAMAPDLAADLESILYESVATVNLLYRKEDVPARLDGVGFVVPKVENTKLSACTFSSQKFEGRTPEDYSLLRAFVGGALYHEEFHKDDRAMESMVKEELHQIAGITARPVMVSIRRYPQAMPQYHVGHLEKCAALQERVKAIPGLFLTGNAYEGIGIPDCVRMAQKQAEALCRLLLS